MFLTPRVLAFALVAAVGCGGGSKQTPSQTAASAQPAAAEPQVDRSKAHVADTFRYATADTVAVASFDVQRLRGTAIYDAVVAAIMSDRSTAEDIDEIATQTGVDLRQDLRSATLFLPGSAMQGGEQLLFVLEAAMDEAKVADYIKSKGGELEPKQVDGEAYFEVEGEGGLAFRGDFAVFGSLPMFEAALASARTGTTQSGVSDLLARVDTSKHAFFVAALPPALRQQLGAAAPQAADIQTIVATVDATSGLALSMTAGMSSPESADTLATMLGQLVQQVAADPQLQQMGLSQSLQNARITANGAELVVQLELDEQTVQTLLGLLGTSAG